MRVLHAYLEPTLDLQHLRLDRAVRAALESKIGARGVRILATLDVAVHVPVSTLDHPCKRGLNVRMQLFVLPVCHERAAVAPSPMSP